MTSNRKEIEEMVLSGWLTGNHMNDMERISEKDFRECVHIAKAVKKHGANLFKVAKEAGMQTYELAEITTHYTESFYQQAVSELLESKTREYLKRAAENAPIGEIKETLSKIDAVELESIPEPESNLCGRYWQELDRRAGQKLVRTGITNLDNILCGIRTKELTAIGARPSVGKSAFTLQIAVNVARQGEKVLYFPLEMDTLQTVERILLRYLDVPQMKLRKGDVDWNEVGAWSDKVHELESSGNFLIFEAVNDIDVIKALIKRHKPYLVVIDQLEQMKSSCERFKDKRERFSYMTNSLKRISMTDNVAVMLACQVNRGAGDSEPTMAHLKESGSIEEDSDNVILLHKIPLKDMESGGWSDNERPMLINVAKQRSGETGTLYSKFIANKFTFYDLEG